MFGLTKKEINLNSEYINLGFKFGRFYYCKRLFGFINYVILALLDNKNE